MSCKTSNQQTVPQLSNTPVNAIDKKSGRGVNRPPMCTDIGLDWGDTVPVHYPANILYWQKPSASLGCCFIFLSLHLSLCNKSLRLLHYYFFSIHHMIHHIIDVSENINILTLNKTIDRSTDFSSGHLRLTIRYQQ